MQYVIKLLPLFLCLCSCGNTSSSASLDCTPDTKAKLEEYTLKVVSHYVLETINQNGTKIYIDFEGNGYYREDACRVPFSIEGTGVLLKNGFLGTVQHLDKRKAIFSPSEIELWFTEHPTALVNFARTVDQKSLLPMDQYPYQLHRMNTFAIKTNSPVEPIRESIRKKPFETPRFCQEIELMYSDEGNDVAVYEFVGKDKPEASDGYGLCDLMTDAELKSLRNGAHIIARGFPTDIRGIMNSKVESRLYDFSTLSGTIAPGFNALMTDIEASPGASGSFVIDKTTGKIIGLISMRVDAETLCAPVTYMRELYVNAMEAQR